MDCAVGSEGVGFEVADGFQVLNSDTFVVLGAAGVDGAGGGAVGGEGIVEPFLGLGGDGVEVGVEKEGGSGMYDLLFLLGFLLI